MSIKKIKLTILFLSLILTLPFSSKEIDVTQPLRISEIIPGDRTLITLAIDPALPDNFVTVSNSGELAESVLSLSGEKKLSTPLLKTLKIAKDLLSLLAFPFSRSSPVLGV